MKQTTAGVTGITTSEQDHRLDFPTGGSIAIRSTHYPDNLRGAGLDFAALDEAAFMDARVWPEIVRPMLLESRGGAIFLSTPCGKNWFWDLYQQGLDPDQPEWASFHFPSWTNPLVSPDEIEHIRRSTPERIFREEYMAEFIDDSGLVFRGIREAATAPMDAAPDETHRYLFGVDWGREVDYTAIAVLDATTRQLVALDRFNKVGWSLQRGRLLALAKVWNPEVIWAESNSIGSVNIEALQNEGLPMRSFTTTASSKAPLIEGLALAIERRDIALLPDATLMSELSAYTMQRSPGGGYRYSAPSGQHDDTVIATALAWYGVQNGGLRVDFA